MSLAAAHTSTKPAHGREFASSQAQLVTFELFGETFALPILDVREVIHLPNITPVPQAPNFVEGVINLRGQIIPIVDLRRRFGMQSERPSDESRIIVVELTNGVNLGLIVDVVSDIERIPFDAILPPPSLIAGSIGAEYIKGISNHEDKMIIHIDLRKVFSLEELSALEATAA